jgi:hypothetical protein
MVCATQTRQKNRLLLLPMSIRKLRIILRFSMGLHDLSIATGRLRGIPRHERWCDQCSLHLVGDEQHFVFNCPFLQQVRDRYPDLFHLPIRSLQQFLWQEDIVQVINFVVDCFAFAPNKTTTITHFVVKNSSKIWDFYFVSYGVPCGFPPFLFLYMLLVAFSGYLWSCTYTVYGNG